jgi:DNA-binding response OmpR family regulator
MLMTNNQVSGRSSPHVSVCPHCGTRNEFMTEIKVGAWHLRPAFAMLRGSPLHLTGAEAVTLYTLGKAAGDVVDPVTLSQQFSMSTDYSSSVRVIISRLRKKLGADCPIQTVRGAGYRWH